MLRSCPNEGDCEWRNGIINHRYTSWSIITRVLIGVATVCNVIVVALFLTAFIFKIKKLSKFVTPTMEIGNFTMTASFICLYIGFSIFISSGCNFSLWLHVLSMVILFCSCNLLTRTFATILFQNYTYKSSKSVEKGIAHSKLAEGSEEVVALTSTVTEEVKTAIEMDEVKRGSSELLITGSLELKVASVEDKTATD
jgi:hypothetical protein